MNRGSSVRPPTACSPPPSLLPPEAGRPSSLSPQPACPCSQSNDLTSNESTEALPPTLGRQRETCPCIAPAPMFSTPHLPMTYSLPPLPPTSWESSSKSTEDDANNTSCCSDTGGVRVHETGRGENETGWREMVTGWGEMVTGYQTACAPAQRCRVAPSCHPQQTSHKTRTTENILTDRARKGTAKVRG